MKKGRIEVATPSRSYDVVVGRGILTEEIAAAAATIDTAERAAIVTDDGVPGRWPEAVAEGLRSAGVDSILLSFPKGEASKTIETAGYLLEEMASAALHRGDFVVGVGGGVVTDIAGFVASVYMRGIALVQVPTTLLAMVDASVGGKTAVNLKGWKNLVGSFYQPVAVIADISCLKTLDEAEMKTGMAEVAKYGFIAKPAILEQALDISARISSDISLRESDEVADMVRSCIEVKASVVSRDEKESGIREILNFGHTLGHALERATSHKMSHGEAIAVGMAFEAELSRIEGLSDLRESITKALAGLGLPTTVEGVGRQAVLDAMALDKKYSRGLRFVLLESIGSAVVRRIEESSKIDEALESVGI